MEVYCYCRNSSHLSEISLLGGSVRGWLALILSMHRASCGSSTYTLISFEFGGQLFNMKSDAKKKLQVKTISRMKTGKKENSL